MQIFIMLTLYEHFNSIILKNLQNLHFKLQTLAIGSKRQPEREVIEVIQPKATKLSSKST